MMATNALMSKNYKASDNHDLPVDLAHLARRTLGNGELEKEILRLFERQSVIYLNRLKGAGGSTDRNKAAQVIMGSAKSIGAWRIASLAETFEGDRTPITGIRNMELAIGMTNEFIREILQDC